MYLMSQVYSENSEEFGFCAKCPYPVLACKNNRVALVRALLLWEIAGLINNFNTTTDTFIYLSNLVNCPKLIRYIIQNLFILVKTEVCDPYTVEYRGKELVVNSHRYYALSPAARDLPLINVDGVFCDDIDDISFTCDEDVTTDIAPYIRMDKLNQHQILDKKRPSETPEEFNQRLKNYAGQLNFRCGRANQSYKFIEFHPLLGKLLY